MHSLTSADCDENQWGVHSTSTCSLQLVSSLHPRTSAKRLPQTCPALVHVTLGMQARESCVAVLGATVGRA
jgi:hypothetical protein